MKMFSGGCCDEKRCNDPDRGRTDRYGHCPPHGRGMKIVIGDKSLHNARAVAEILNSAGFDAEAVEMDLASRESIRNLIKKAREYGQIAMLVNAAGVSPSQAPVEAILKVDLYGTAVLLEEVGKVIREGGTGVTISSQSGHRMPALTPEEDEQLACTPAEELLDLPYFSRNISKIPCTPTRWQSAAMRSGSWQRQ